ncbi:glycosyl hydrolase [Paenibacillus sp. BIHB 4019]|uniref:Glycosyl hydrolase n=1 Tax=Paenibacillus sp. BIHB 4019 TaxID=1870819 RepID=A0A1B2DLS9_9BACL|nr:family 43 glycosylhydrolase [Paenibacillus sp. BIHB 4019]ANY68655.1 glycosyl hydrolase [Paenibacillus sp. BIHB 4019]
MTERFKRETAFLLSYTRTPLQNEIYAPKLAYSMHLAISEDGEAYTALNHNSGVLFAKATVHENGSLLAKSLKNPYFFTMVDGTYGIVAVRIEHAGGRDDESKGHIMLFTSCDLISYVEVGLIDLKAHSFVDDVICEYNGDKKLYEINWLDDAGNYYTNTMLNMTDLSSASLPKAAGAFAFQSSDTDIEGALERNIIRVPVEIGDKVKAKLAVLANTEIRVPETIFADAAGDLAKVKAEAVYTDGSTAAKRVDWDTGSVDWETPGTYEITGNVHQDVFPFPIAVNRADPCIIKWKDNYYFIATNDNTSINQGFYVRSASTIAGLANADESLILGNGHYPFLEGIFWWAPEFHKVGDELYVFFAGSSGEFGQIHSHVMKLKSAGDPLHAGDWEMPIRVEKKDGSYLFEAGITLDMTYLEADGKSYVLWAQRQFSPVDLGSWLYIASVDPMQPWRLADDPVLLSKPEYGWANNCTFVDEGPYAIVANENVFLTFSSALVNETYCVGILTARRGADLLNPESWTKGNYPLLTSRSVAGEYGPGHNAYVSDDDGNLLNVYHARPGINEPRCSGVRRVHFDIDGYPVLDLTEERDLNPDLKAVRTKVVVANGKTKHD